jgi:acyl-CoA thioesterase II
MSETPLSPVELITIAHHDDVDVGRCIAGAPGRVFGGHTLAQAMVSASTLIEHRRPPNSLHAYFLAPGNPEVDMTYRSSPVKLGRSIDIVGVTASQDGIAVLSVTTSFHDPEPGHGFQVPMPPVPDVDTLEERDYRPVGTNPGVRAPFELRYIDDRFRDTDGPDEHPQLGVWIRTRQRIGPARPFAHAALLTYAVDFLITRASHLPIRGTSTTMLGASLDHSMWFHRPFRADEWLFVECRGLSFAGARALSVSAIYRRDGELVASGSQEALLRSDAPHPTIPTKETTRP